ncbi:MAG TPA: 3-isopropylmalate dehydratase small subunit [Steroidobacter sp.]|nr:3-isopropylmalate dehydratase small subunit [Steroidobacter sp.]
MKKFERLDGLVAPLDRANVDTDAIIPKQFLKSIRRTGFGPNLFDEWRYLGRDEGRPRVLNPDFVLNEPRYLGATVLLARANFGCGSSREHAVWALEGFGFRAIVAPSFADIFYGNCFKNGVLPVRLPAAEVNELFLAVARTPGYRLSIDLETQTVTRPEGAVLRFEVDEFQRRCLLDGLDDIELTLRRADRIRSYEAQRQRAEPWLFPELEPQETA